MPPEEANPDKLTLDEWFTTVYQELRSLARTHLSVERADHTLQPTALVHEVFMRLQKDGSLNGADESKFFLTAAEAMRRVLIEHARSRGAQKRGGTARRIALQSADWVDERNLDQIVTIDDAILRMEESAPQAAQVVRLRIFAGLQLQETARVMRISVPTVTRLWRFARAWLWRELRASG